MGHDLTSITIKKNDLYEILLIDKCIKRSLGIFRFIYKCKNNN